MNKSFKTHYTKRLLKVIPGGAHTYSKGADQFPLNAPSILKSGNGSYVTDINNKKLLDYGMGLRSVNIGYSEKKINDAAYKQILNGNNLSRPSTIELKASEEFVKLIKHADMVKFTKHGSTAVTAAVKLARAYTKKKIILRCLQHPFFSFDDWFIGSTVINKGIPKEIIKLTKFFNYNNIFSLKKKIQRYKNDIACVVMEAATTECPNINDSKDCCSQIKCIRKFKYQNHYLKQVENLCKENKIVFILDEMITGFRWNIGGAQEFYNIKPDLSTFGKAMANGFSIAAVCGKRKIMELGSIEKKNQERVFLLSTTHGAEMSSLGAFIETLKFIRKKKVIEKNWNYGGSLIQKLNELSSSMGMIDYFSLSGVACSPYYTCRDKKGNLSLSFRTLFMQEMIKSGVLIPWVSICYRHSKNDLKKTINAAKKSLTIYKKALSEGIDKYLKGNSIKAVFRRFN